jgi:hypothetical protein
LTSREGSDVESRLDRVEVLAVVTDLILAIEIHLLAPRVP